MMGVEYTMLSDVSDTFDTPSDGEGPLVEIRATALSGDVTVKRA